MPNDRKLMLVTGAGGFIGGWVAEEAFRHERYRVRAGIRRWTTAARIARFPMDIALVDVLNMESIDAAMEGVDVVVHCSFGTTDVTVRGTENMLRAALEHGVTRFVHLSTIDVYGTPVGDIGEDHPLVMTGSEYGDSKNGAEQKCREFMARGLPVTILRPTIVYGPYCKLWVAKFAERLNSGRWGVFAQQGEGWCNLLYVTDLVDAIFRSIERDEAVGHAFNISGPETITWNEYFLRFNKQLGLPPLPVISSARSSLSSRVMQPVKRSARFTLQHFQDPISRLYQRSQFAKSLFKRMEEIMKATPGPGELGVFSRRTRFPISKAVALLGYAPSIGPERGIALSVQWLLHEFSGARNR